MDANSRTQVFAWTPDEGQVVRGWMAGGGATNRGLEVRTADLKVVKTVTLDKLAPGFLGQNVMCSLRFLDADRLYVSGHGVVAKGEGSGAVGLVVNVKEWTTRRLFGDSHHGMFTPFGAASASGELAATTTNKGLVAVVYKVADGKPVATCGTPNPLPWVVGWVTDAKAPAVAWATDDALSPFTSKPADLTDAFDLGKLEPLPAVKPADFRMRVLAADPWKIDYTKGPGVFLQSAVKNTATAAHKFDGPYRSITLVPRGKDPPLVANAQHDYQLQMGNRAALWTADGKKVADWLPTVTDARDMVPSPDGRYVLLSTGTHRLSVYRTDGSKFPFLNLAVVRGEWVLWTGDGYYTASPGGEKMVGWAVSHGPNALSEFLPAGRYAKLFRRPDVIRLAVEKGSVADALVALQAAAPDVETILPPRATLALVKQQGATVTVTAEAKSPTKGKPVLAMRVLLDGRPLANGVGVWNPDGPQPASGEFTFDIPAGLHELKVLARTEDGSAVSGVLAVRGPKEKGKQPTLHRVCVGVSEYEQADLTLGSAAKDAAALFAALEKHCVGADNLFGTAAGELLLNKDATRERVLKAIAAVRKAAKPGDLVAVCFAGHGVKQKDDFFLLTRESDPTKPLAGFALSGDDLRKELAQVECPVLLVLDACHAAAGVKALRPATDDLTRDLTDDKVGVTVLSAAMSHETAGETAEHGHFTAGLLKGLAAGTGVPFDPYEKQLYVHHLYAVAYSEVRRATGGKQNPFLNMPWTMSPVAVREVPAR